MSLLDEVKFLDNYKKQAIAKRGLKDLYFFNREILERDNPDRQANVVPHVHREWTDWLDKSKKRHRLMLVPRNTLKSTFLTVGGPLQKIAENPNVRILIANAKLDNAKKFLSEIKNHIRYSEPVIENYGELYSNDLKWTEDEIEVVGRRAGTREPTVMAIGAGAGLAGLHFDYIYGDDLVNEINTATREQALKIIEWWRRSMSLLDPVTGVSTTIGTRWSYYDLYQHIIDELGDNVDVFHRSAYKEDGSPYYPELLPLDRLDELRALEGSYMFSAFYLNDPVDEETSLIKRSNIHYYGRECPCGETHRKPKKRELAIFTTCDPAISKSITADYTGIVTVGVDVEGNWYVLETARGRWSVLEMVERLFDTYDRYQPKGMSVEVIGSAQMLLENIHTSEALKGKYLPIVPIKTRSATAKRDRIFASLQARFERGNVFIGPNMPELEDELSRYPRSKHDDLIDALSDVSEISYTPDREQEEKKEPVTIQERILDSLSERDRPFVDTVLGEEF